MPRFVIKRSGAVEPFDLGKIETAIGKVTVTISGHFGSAVGGAMPKILPADDANKVYSVR